MNEMTPKERLINTIKGKNVDKTPVLSVTQTGTKDIMDLAGVYWPEAHFDSLQMASLAFQAHTSIGFEAVRVPFCLTVLLEALGCRILQGKTTRQPSIASHPYNSQQPLTPKPITDNILKEGRVPIVCDAVKILSKRCGKELPIIAGAEGPVTVASDLLEITTFMKWSIKKRDAVCEYLNYGAKAVVKYANALLDAGADVFALLDPVASPELMNPKDFKELILPVYQKMSSQIKGKVILHICGDVTMILPYLKETGFDAVSIEEKTDMKEAKKILGDKIRVVGNVATATTLFNGTPKQAYDESIIALKKGTDVLAPGCGLAPLSPLENCEAMIEAREDYFKI
ncbi:MAG: methylcobamide:CoM methyltransferase MtaA [Candidatus Methanofastidiosia archaeon]